MPNPSTIAMQDETKNALREFLNAHDWVVLTATVEAHGAWDCPENVAANDSLRLILSKSRYVFIEGEGVYFNRETGKSEFQGPSFIVHTPSWIDRGQLIDFAKTLHQESILIPSGLLFMKSMRVEATTTEIVFGERALAEDYYTTYEGDAFSSILRERK